MQNELTGLLTGPARVTGISLPENLMHAARERAIKEERPFSWVIQRALVGYLTEGCEEAPAGLAEGEAEG